VVAGENACNGGKEQQRRGRDFMFFAAGAPFVTRTVTETKNGSCGHEPWDCYRCIIHYPSGYIKSTIACGTDLFGAARWQFWTVSFRTKDAWSEWVLSRRILPIWIL